MCIYVYVRIYTYIPTVVLAFRPPQKHAYIHTSQRIQML